MWIHPAAYQKSTKVLLNSFCEIQQRRKSKPLSRCSQAVSSASVVGCLCSGFHFPVVCKGWPFPGGQGPHVFFWGGLFVFFFFFARSIDTHMPCFQEVHPRPAGGLMARDDRPVLSTIGFASHGRAARGVYPRRRRRVSRSAIGFTGNSLIQRLLFLHSCCWELFLHFCLLWFSG